MEKKDDNVSGTATEDVNEELESQASTRAVTSGVSTSFSVTGSMIVEINA